MLAFALGILLWQWTDDFLLKQRGVDKMNQVSCESAGGAWNECASACRGDDGPCIAVCVEECGCAQDDQCPIGYFCGEYIDGDGICLQEY